MFHADPLGVLALIAVAMCWSLSVVLFRIGERGSVARKLALVLVVEGLALVSCGLIEYLFFTVPDDFYQHNPRFAIIETCHSDLPTDVSKENEEREELCQPKRLARIEGLKRLRSGRDLSELMKYVLLFRSR